MCGEPLITLPVVSVEAEDLFQLSGRAAGIRRARAAGSSWRMRCGCTPAAELLAGNELFSLAVLSLQQGQNKMHLPYV